MKIIHIFYMNVFFSIFKFYLDLPLRLLKNMISFVSYLFLSFLMHIHIQIQEIRLSLFYFIFINLFLSYIYIHIHI